MIELDTGSNITCISQNLARRLNLSECEEDVTTVLADGTHIATSYS